MAIKLISITPRADGGRDVVYDEDDMRRLACQVYNTKACPQRFSWVELTMAIDNHLLPLVPTPPPDPRTEEQKTADSIREIKGRLRVLDAEVPRVAEDLVVVVKKLDDKFVLDPAKQAIIDEKAALRAELATLASP